MHLLHWKYLTDYIFESLAVSIWCKRCLHSALYSTRHVRIRLLEKWRNKLDDNLFLGGVLTDVSKAFDCLPHNLIIDKMTAYGIQNGSLSLLFSYLANWNQCARIYITYSTFKEIISGTPQGSILGPASDLSAAITQLTSVKRMERKERN